MNSIQPLRFITRAVLPLVYDESLSYYEFLCKVLDKLNIVITNSNTQSEAIKALNTELKNFKASTDAKFLEYQTNVERLFDEVEAKLNLKEDTANKTQIITDSSTEAQYPSAKAVNDVIKALNTDLNNKEDTDNKTQVITDSATEAQYPSAKAVLEYVKAHAGGGADIVSFDFPHGQETVTYDTTDGITMAGQARLTDANGKTNDIAATVGIPIKAGDGISINATADGTGVEVKNTNIIALEYSTPTQSIVSKINDADIAAKYDDYDNVISTTYATKTELPVYKTIPDGAIYKINNKDIAATYDDAGNVISTTYATKTELPVYKTLPEAGIYSINNNDIVAKYDETGNVISTTYATKTELNSKLDKTSDGLKIYATDDIGNQTTVDYTNDILPSSIPLRKASGNLAGNTPITNDDYTTKSYVDNKAEAWTFTLDDGTTVTKNVLVN